MKGLRLYKTEKLCSRTAVSLLFEQGHSSIAFPLRAVYRFHDSVRESPAQFLITIPKKKIRSAVCRVLLRRRTRESYRLWRRTLLYPTLLQTGLCVDIAFLYLDKEPVSYTLIEDKMKQLLTRIAQASESHNTSAQP